MNYKKEFDILSSMPKELRWIGDSVLRKKTKDIVTKNITDIETRKISRQLISVLKKVQKFGRGVAITAPQIGISKSIIVIGIEGEYITFINPKILNYSKDKNTYPEGCLSSLPLVAETARPSAVTVSYYDLSGEFHKEKFEGKMARILQHEIDHLNGILCVEKGDIKTVQYIFNWEDFKKNAELKNIKK